MNERSTYKLGIVVSHPIQYYSPLFRYLAKKLNITVLYCHNPTEDEIGRNGFGLKFKWDIDLLEGYPYIFLKNVSAAPDLSRFRGCDTPDIGTAIKENGITHVLIMGWYLKSYWQAFFYCLRKNIPVAVRGDSTIDSQANGLKSFAKKIMYPLFIRRYAKLLYVGELNKQYLLRHGARPAQLLFAPHAVDQSFWTSKPREKSSSNSKIIFLWVAKFIPVKRPLDMVEGFCKAYEKKKDIELWMVGSGELLQETVKAAGSNPGIKFLGFKNQTELREIYSQSDCLVITSRHETWGLVVNEAIAMGIPVIVSDSCGCVPDMILENQTGYTYKMGDTEDLAERINRASEKIKSGSNFFANSIKEKNSVYSFESNFLALREFISTS